MEKDNYDKLWGAAHYLRVLADSIDEDECKSPSFLGGTVRAATVLLFHVCEIVRKRGEL